MLIRKPVAFATAPITTKGAFNPIVFCGFGVSTIPKIFFIIFDYDLTLSFAGDGGFVFKIPRDWVCAGALRAYHKRKV